MREKIRKNIEKKVSSGSAKEVITKSSTQKATKIRTIKKPPKLGKLTIASIENAVKIVSNARNKK